MAISKHSRVGKAIEKMVGYRDHLHKAAVDYDLATIADAAKRGEIPESQCPPAALELKIDLRTAQEELHRAACDYAFYRSTAMFHGWHEERECPNCLED